MAFGGFVYIIVNKHHTVFYVGVAASISSRIEQHRQKLFPMSFSAKYKTYKLVYYEFHETIEGAIAREKQIKKYSRFKKVRLIVPINPTWRDLYKDIQYL